MKDFNEQFMTYIWFHKLFYPEQTTLMGQQVEIVSVGTANNDAGPDVFNAKVKIDGVVWAGNVEFHTRATDWHLHGHDGDIAYERVVLHVVLEADEQIMLADGRLGEKPIPTIMLRYPEHIKQRVQEMMGSREMCGCGSELSGVDHLFMTSWIDRLVVERMERKTAMIEKILDQTKGDWAEAFYIILMRSFGFNVNSEAMEELAKRTPYKYLMHHRDNQAQVEAMLLGQARMLDGKETAGEQERYWIREYSLMKSKFEFEPMSTGRWKYAKTRPGGFPSIRIAQIAAILCCTDNIFASVVDNPELKHLRSLLKVAPSEYWQTHYSVGIPSEHHSGRMTQSSIDNLIINTVIPFLFHYGHIAGRNELRDQAMSLLDGIEAENNYITRYFTSIGVSVRTAYESQAVIQWMKNYCERRDCLRCHLSYRLMKQHIN